LAHLGLLLVFDLAAQLWATLLLLGIAHLALWRTIRRLASAPLGVAHILIVAAILRALLLPLPPTLSNDALRYVWDGRVLLAGENPYLLAPEEEALAPLRDDLWEAMDHRDVPTVYPPFALAVFAAAAALPFGAAIQLLGLKLLLLLADLAACAAVVYLAQRRGLPTSRSLWYAWNPLVCLEVAGMGHVDALGVLMVVLAVSWLKDRPLASAAAAAGGVLAKLIPLILWPLWGLRNGRPVRYWVACIAIAGTGLVPVVLATGGTPPGLVRYGISWEFNGPLYEPLWRASEVAAVDERVEGLLGDLKERTGRHDFWNRFYPMNYPQAHAKALLLLVLGLGALLSLRYRDPVCGTGFVLGMVVICSSTVYPWYLLWVLPWAALAEHRAWLWLAALLPLSYLPQFTAIPYFPCVYLAIWLPFAALLMWSPRWSTD